MPSKTLKLSKGQILTRNNIYNLLNDARGVFGYIKFILYDGTYYNVTFNRDLTIEISTNSINPSIVRQMQNLKISWTQARIAEFIFQKINFYN